MNYALHIGLLDALGWVIGNVGRLSLSRQEVLLAYSTWKSWFESREHKNEDYIIQMGGL